MNNWKSLIFSLMLIGFLFEARAQRSIEYAEVLSVDPVYKLYSSYELSEPICRIVSVPVERKIPIYKEEVNQGNPLVGILVGAIIGNQMFDSTEGARAAGTILGSIVGNTLSGQSRRVITGYVSETYYIDQQSCERESVFLTRSTLMGFNVTYDHSGVSRTVFMKEKPGTHVKIITTHHVYP